jgi:NAD-dependent DNA ligase
MNIQDSARMFARLRRFNVLYSMGMPAVPDTIYDELYDRAYRANPFHYFFKEVGSGYGVETALPVSMPSLTKLRPDDAFGWSSAAVPKKHRNTPLIVLPKLDGAAILLEYAEDGRLVRALTRGNGRRGMDVTAALRLLNIPKHIYTHSCRFYVRGELVLSKDAFRRLSNQITGFDYVNARNTVVGCLNAKNKNEDHVSILRAANFIAFSAEFVETKAPGSEAPSNVRTKTEQLKYLQLQGFDLPPFYTSSKRNGTATLTATADKDWPAAMKTTIRALREKYPFETDGIVIEFDFPGAQKMGEDANGLNPAWARAVKLDPSEQDAKTIKVSGINWQRTPRGIVKPVVVLEYDALFQGVRVRNVFVDNARYVKANKIGPGAVVTVIRSGDVIPRIIAIDQPSPDKIKLPKLCLKHGEALVWTDTKTDLYCPICSGELNSPAEFFNQLEADGVGKTLINHVCEALQIESVKDLLELHPSKLSSIEKFSTKRSSQFKEAITKAIAEASLAKIMHASGAFRSEKLGLGEARLQSIIDQIGVERLMKPGSVLPARDLEHLARRAEGVGDQVAKCFGEQFINFYTLFEDLRSFSTTAANESAGKAANKGVLSGVKFCFTGFRSSDAETIIRRNGGSIANTVSKGISVLFAASADTTKAAKARKLGIVVIEPNQTIKFLENIVKRKMKKAGIKPTEEEFSSAKPRKKMKRKK